MSTVTVVSFGLAGTALGESVVEPFATSLEGVASRNVVNEEHARTAAVV